MKCWKHQYDQITFKPVDDAKDENTDEIETKGSDTEDSTEL